MEDFIPYLLLVGFTLVEGGEVSLLFGAYLAHTYALPIPLIGTLLLLTVLVGDILWYHLGAHIYRLPLVSALPAHLARVDRLIVRRPFMTALVARFSYGLHRLLIARYRANGITGAYMYRILFGTALVWFLLLGGVLFVLVGIAPSLKGYFHLLELLLAFFLVGVFLFERVSALYLRKVLNREDSHDAGVL